MWVNCSSCFFVYHLKNVVLPRDILSDVFTNAKDVQIQNILMDFQVDSLHKCNSEFICN